MACLPGSPCNPVPVDIVSPKKCNNGWFAGYPINSNLICYSGPALPNSGVTVGDNLNCALEKLDEELSPVNITQSILQSIISNPHLAFAFCQIISGCIPTTTTTTSTTSAPLGLRLMFTDIESANSVVGDATSVSDWNTFFDLPTLGGAFTSVDVIGSEVILYGGSNIKVKPGLFYPYFENTFLVSVIDEAGCITSVGGDAFSGCHGLTTVDLPECTLVYGYEDSPYQNWGGFGYCIYLVNVSFPKLITTGSWSFGYVAFTSITLPALTSTGYAAFHGCPDLVTIDMPALVYTDAATFRECASLFNVNLPSLAVVGELSSYGVFQGCDSLTTISLPSASIIMNNAYFGCTALTSISLPNCNYLGQTIGDDGVFASIVGNNITLTVPAFLTTYNSGGPDGDIQYLQANNTVTIITV